MEALRNFGSFKTTFRTTKLLFDGLNLDRAMFSGNSHSAKKLHLLYDRDNQYYTVITNLKGAMAKKYICNGCDTLYNTHKCDKVCSLCTATPPILRIRPSIVIHATDSFSVRNVFRIITSQSERQANLSVETSILKL